VRPTGFRQQSREQTRSGQRAGKQLQLPAAACITINRQLNPIRLGSLAHLEACSFMRTHTALFTLTICRCLFAKTSSCCFRYTLNQTAHTLMSVRLLYSLVSDSTSSSLLVDACARKVQHQPSVSLHTASVHCAQAHVQLAGWLNTRACSVCLVCCVLCASALARCARHFGATPLRLGVLERRCAWRDFSYLDYQNSLCDD